MSQFKIAMKKDSMTKNKKLLINIALDKDALASRLEADHDLIGSSSEEKQRSESSERRRDVSQRVGSKAEQNLGSSRVEIDRFKSESRKDVFQRVCSKAEETDKATDDRSSVRDGRMCEVDVGTGLSGALNRLREQGTFKGESKLVSVKDNHDGDRFKDGFKDIQIQRVDKWGRILTQKEAYRSLCHGFHGKGPGKRKQEKRKKQQEDKSKQMESSERAVERLREQKETISMHPKTKQSRLVTVDDTSKNTHLCSENFEDKFSSLHESVLSRILSHLPTVEAVSTSVLSKTWRSMWTNITELQFDDRMHRDPMDSRFTEFVERVLGDIGSPYINSFHLCSVNSYDENLLISWLSKVLKRNLQKLIVTCYELESVNFSPLFPSLVSLVELRLRTKSILDISAPALLPNLKFFSLEDARIFNMSSVSKNLVLNFPVLETFEASYCCCFRTEIVILDSPLLRVFEMFKCTSEHVPSASQVCKIRVLASKLEKITFSGNDSRKIHLSFPPSLPDAYLTLSGPQWPRKFLRSFICVKSLGLELSKDFQVMRVPKFRQLIYLHLIYDMTQHCKLRQFLKSAPILEMLSIRDMTSPRIIPTAKSLEELRSQESPDCVRTMLKVLQIRNFKPSRLQLSVLRYVMGNAEILGSVILSSPNPITEEAKARILTYPKASPHASVFFE